MRFTKNNWNKYFDGSNKKTTIRLKKSRLGHQKAYAGSYIKPEVLGEFDIVDIKEIKFKDLKLIDALLDGFGSEYSLKEELTRLNGKIEPDTILYIHWTDNIVKEEDKLVVI